MPKYTSPTYTMPPSPPTPDSPAPLPPVGFGPMGFKSAVVLATALAGLLLLQVLSLVAVKRRVQSGYAQWHQIEQQHRQVEAKLRKLRSDIHLSGIFIRDYLLDSSHITGPAYREKLTGLRREAVDTSNELERSMRPRQAGRMESLSAKLEEYWQTFDPLFDWTPQEKTALSSVFLRREVLPKRDAVLALAQEIEAFNNVNMAEQRDELAGRERELYAYINRLLVLGLLLGIVVSVAGVYRLNILERRGERQRRRAEAAEGEMRRLSHLLVRAQEEERRHLSRELHDEVGQMLTGLRMELGKAERERATGNGAFTSHMQDSKHVVDTLIHTVRDLSMGLRPSMLDDFGLKPALEWQARDFSRRFGLPLDLRLEGDLDGITEPHRTAVYRIVQEALTNCARHAQATRISVSVRGGDERLLLSITDDGIGFSAEARSNGLGLLGIKERVRELAGRIAIDSARGRGTTLRIELPVEPAPRLEEELAHPDRR